MRTLAIIQARMSSSRLPGKVLKPLAGKPMIIRMVERVSRARFIDKLVVATSTDKSDDPLAHILAEAGIPCYRGSLNDVLSRYCEATDAFGPAEAIVRLTGDCPLIDWQILDALIEFFRSEALDYASNISPPTYPDGMDAEIMTVHALLENCKQARTSFEREHVTPYIREHPETFRQGNLACSLGDLSWHRLTVDEPEDYEKARIIFENMYPQKPDFVLEDILSFLEEKPDVMNMNQHIKRNEGACKPHEST